jgi:hypothetical protein
MLNALRICLLVLGVSAVAISLSIFCLGAAFTASWAEALFNLMSGWRGPGTGVWPATMDSELRFYAALWGAYGAVVIRTGLNLKQRLQEAPWVAAVFFAGGVGRIVSRVSLGAPHPFFTMLLIIEVSLPVIMLALWFGANGKIGYPRDRVT